MSKFFVLVKQPSNRYEYPYDSKSSAIVLLIGCHLVASLIVIWIGKVNYVKLKLIRYIKQWLLFYKHSMVIHFKRQLVIKSVCFIIYSLMNAITVYVLFIFVEQATDASLLSEDWALFMEICDMINDSDEGYGS